MSGNSSDIDRRSVLRKTGIGAVSIIGIAGAAGSVSAERCSTPLSTGDWVTPIDGDGYTMSVMADLDEIREKEYDRNVELARTGLYEVIDTYTNGAGKWLKVSDGDRTGWDNSMAFKCWED